MTGVLSVCSQNRLRSPTAEHAVAERTSAGRDGLDVASAGLNHDAEEPLTPERVAWADVTVVMERAHERRLRQHFCRPLRAQRVVCPGIPDDYAFLDPRLVSILEDRVPRPLGTVGA